MKLFLQLFANGLVNGALYVMMAIGFGITWRSLRIFHVAYAGIYLISGYTLYTLVNFARVTIPIGIVFVIMLSIAIGWTMEIFLYRPFYRIKASFGSTLIASLGLFIVLENVIVMIFGNELKTIQRESYQVWRLSSIVMTDLQVIELCIGLTTIFLFWLLVRRYKLFKALWAMGDQPDLIPILGLPLFQLRSIVLIISTIMIAIPACLMTLDTGITPNIGMSYLLLAAVAVLVGGYDSYKGWVWGSFVLAVVQSLVVWKFSGRWMDLVTFSLLILMLICRPSGILVQEKRLEEAE